MFYESLICAMRESLSPYFLADHYYFLNPNLSLFCVYINTHLPVLYFTVSAPRITKQPEDVNVTTGCNFASFVCTARGFGLLKIFWKRINYTLPITAKVTEHNAFSELSSTLTISEIVGYYSGRYYCVAENEVGKITSQTVNLHVKESKVATYT